MEKKVILYVLTGTAAFIAICLAVKKTKEYKKIRKFRNDAERFSYRRNLHSDYFGEYTL